MHTTQLHDEEGHRWLLHHNGDYSGDVEFAIEAVRKDRVEFIEPYDYYIVRIPFDVLKELVGQYMQTEAISTIEALDGKAYLDQRNYL